ncbi:MAG: hypothetical protein PHP50_07300 [Lachnospiraceae bacterium]|nr:hypothetical protein [Lachnospiraceae bacterium]
MRINQMEDVMLQGMKPNVPQNEAEFTEVNYDYPGKEELHRFYDSSIAAGKNKSAVEVIEKATLPVGLILSFGLCIAGMLLDMFGVTRSITPLGFLCFFAMIIVKAVLSRQVYELRSTRSNIDFESLYAYRSKYKKYGFTGGRRFPYCLMGDTSSQYVKETKGISQGVWVPILIAVSFWHCLLPI